MVRRKRKAVKKTKSKKAVSSTVQKNITAIKRAVQSMKKKLNKV